MKTKRILYGAMVFLGLLSGTACSDKLDVDLKAAINANSMWKDESDAQAAVTGAYVRMRNTFSTGYIFWGEYRTGYWGAGLETNATYSTAFLNQLNSTHGNANWNSLYTTINDCNLILKHVPEISFAVVEKKNEYLAQAYFMRAFCYYWIGRIWGDAPVLTAGFESASQDDLYPSRQPVQAVFQLVKEDLDRAEELMPTAATKAQYGNLDAIRLLKTDYYLWMAKQQNGGAAALNMAKQSVDKVLTGTHTLMQKFADIFATELNPEVIFCWRMTQDEFTGGYPADFLVPIQYVTPGLVENPIKVGSHQQWIFLTNNYKAFLTENPADTRTKVSFDTAFDKDKNLTFQWINKYAGKWVNATRIFDADLVVYRYADALLFSAEIENALGNGQLAVQQLNKIAKRAYGTDNFYAIGLPTNAINIAILTERKKEFVAEGKLWWDLIRLGVVFNEVESLKNQQSKKNILLWPVHDSSINTNPNIKQTEGYN
ncbi:MAG: RagB/SusD family nutrient uptake outer membrane protein [Sphingobacterium sp.]|jgi:hypothetical protein|nr:RagB/SusD family nutrient uptake outer membrane protein [Sphingobacterium sp.]